METLKSPSKKIPYFHYKCKCGKPVSPDVAWFDGKKQVHFDCLSNANKKFLSEKR